MPETLRGFSISSDFFAEGIRYYWTQRNTQASSAHGGEGQGKSVRGGKHLDEVQASIVTLMIDHGVAPSDIFTECELHKTGKLQLPGYFRPTKKWDMLVVSDGCLLAAMKLKAQVGPSFGNNFNNRTEEAIGSAQDFWTAFREHAFRDSLQPWLGYLFLLEDCAESTRPVNVQEPHFSVFGDFRGASYAKRYELLCRRLVLERKYISTCLLLSRDPHAETKVGDAMTRGLYEIHKTPAASDADHQHETVYREPCADLNADQFLRSLLRAVVPV
ncbi:MAG: hypothetical protein OXG26_15200 [Caldilineaceae bacterium]|nr:hypothetical protein [Caldilineaceae bacterium]